jgi:general secretion pathway protein F
MQYQVKVLNSAMQVEDMLISAASEVEARQLIANSNSRVLELKVSNKTFGGTDNGKDFNLSIFNQQMHSLLEAGQTLVDTIEMLGKNDRKPRNRAIYDALLRELRNGNQLSVAMNSLPSVFPPLYVAMVRSSETTGTVRESISRYMRYQQQIDEIRRKLLAAATYPAILLGVGFMVISFLMLYVLPRFSAVYEDSGTLHQGSVGFVQWWGAFVRSHELLAWGGFAAIIVAGVAAAINPALRVAAYRRLLAMPWLGERITVLQLARLYRTLGMLLHSGVSVLAAMRMTRASLPVAMQPDIDAAILSVSEGMPMSGVMQKSGLSTEVAVRLLVAGESSGNLDEMMSRIADFYDQETAIWIDTAGRLLEPLLMLGIGLVVGAIVLMLYSPIFDLATIV